MRTEHSSRPARPGTGRGHARQEELRRERRTTATHQSAYTKSQSSMWPHSDERGIPLEPATQTLAVERDARNRLLGLG